MNDDLAIKKVRKFVQHANGSQMVESVVRNYAWNSSKDFLRNFGFFRKIAPKLSSVTILS